jgi:ribosomal protein S27E
MGCSIYQFLQAVNFALFSHLIIVFYAKKFEWGDLHPKNLICKVSQYYWHSPSTFVKAWACGVVLARCYGGGLSVQQGRVGVVLLSIPQLYRSRGQLSQELRGAMGPLTPILAACNVWLDRRSFANVAMATTSFLAFVVLRPDNTAVLDLFFLRSWDDHEGHDLLLSNAKLRRKLHGLLAATNAGVALGALVLEALHHNGVRVATVYPSLASYYLLHNYH